jgi:LPXTG-motif cell wall-anchored protein
VQEASGAYPAGVDTTGSVVSITETNLAGDVVSTSTCTTIAPATDTETYCPSEYDAEPGDSVALTQTSAVADLVVDPATKSVGPCTVPVGDPFPCDVTTVVFTDDGLPPSAAPDSATTIAGKSVDVDVLANDNTQGAPGTISAVTQPADGTATIEPAPATGTATTDAATTSSTGAQTVLYAPKAGFVGTDTFSYTLSTANGTSAVKVTSTVDPPPPTAKNDTATTTSGQAVSIDVTANDSANGAKTLTVTALTAPAHGSAKIVGGRVVYTAAAGFVGTDHLTYTVSNGFGTATATITITVSAPPVPKPTPSPASSTGSLANTGLDSEGLLGLAGGLLLAGAGTLAAGRRRRHDGRHAD